MPRPLHRASVDEVITLPNRVLTTKVEIQRIIHEFVEDELGLFDSIRSAALNSKLTLAIETRFERVEREIESYINYKIDKITEATVEKLLSHAVEIEISSRVNKILAERKNKRGF